MAFWTNDNKIYTDGKGNDGSAAYTYLHGLHLYIGTETTNEVVVFKSFIESYNLTFDTEKQEESFGEATIEPSTKSSRFKYSVAINVPSMNDYEARANDRKYYKLEKMIRRLYKQSTRGGSKYTRVNHARILLTNLIYNGAYDSIPQKIKGWEELRQYAVQGTIASISREVDVESGFWDQNTRMVPKAFRIKFELLLNNTYNDKYGEGSVFRGLRIVKKSGSWKLDDKGRKKGAGVLRDTRNWPFGYNANRSDTYQDHAAQRYQDVHKASRIYIEYQFQSYVLKTISFPVYLESLEESFAVETESKFQSVESWNTLIKRNKFRNKKITFSIPMFRDLDGKVTMEKIGWLFRFLIPTTSEDGSMVPSDGKVFIRFGETIKSSVSASNISGAKCHVNSLSIDLDMDMGFWEQPNNFLIPKAVKITMDVDIVEKLK